MADDMIPVRDTSNNAGPSANDPKMAQQRRMVSKWDRDELEDKYLRLHEDYLSLKKHGRKQEDMIKRMATKLLRLAKDKKKHGEGGKGEAGLSTEAEEKILELQDKVQALEKVNMHLKEKVVLLKQQVQTAGRTIPAPYSHVQSRIFPKQHHTVTMDPKITKNLRVIGPAPHESPKRSGSPSIPKDEEIIEKKRRDEQVEEKEVQSSPPPRKKIVSSPPFHHGHGVLETTRAEKRILEDNVHELQEQLNMYEMEIEQLREQARLREAEFENELIKFKTQVTADQRQVVQENIDLIKLQRDVKEKSTRLIALQEKYTALEENTQVLRQNNDQVIMEMERLNVNLKEEQNRVLTLQNQLKMGEAERRHTVQLKEQVIDLQEEINTLKEANEKLVASAFDLEREREWRQRENKLKVQIAQLEATLKADLGEKGGIIDKYSNTRDAYDKLEQENREMQIQYFQMKEQFDDLNEKLKFFTKESHLDMTELEDALVLIKQKKQKELPSPDFLQVVDSELDKDYKRHLLELQAEYAETVHELEKTRNMLVVQHKINKDYQRETELANQQLQETKKEYELKLDEYARLLDIRAARIKKLEAQLRDVAYGTRQYRIPPPDEDMESTIDLEETLQLERGQNLFEIHVQKINLSEDAVRHIGDEDPSLFCTWEFFEFEIQSTPAVRGSRPVYDFTSQYIVKVDDFFLHYLQKQTCTLELHQSFGQEFRTVAACQLVFRDIFDKPSGRIHGMAMLTGVADSETGVGYGTVEYWVRLRVPMEQALRLYKERTKALGYLTANERQMKDDLKALDDDAAKRPLDNVNELHIKIIKCSKLKARRTDVQPSPYCVYQFFDFSDHDTVIVRNSNNPEFHDHKTYPVPMTANLDQYLHVRHLDIFVFDDADPEMESYIGKARIPLMPLLDDKGQNLKGTFPLIRPTPEDSDAPPDREQSLGTIDVELYWQYPYVRPPKVKHTPMQMDAAPQDVPEKLPRGHSPPRSSMKRPIGPSAHSTPMPREKMSAIERQMINREPAGSVSSVNGGDGDPETSPKPARRRVRMEGEGDEMVNNAVVNSAVSRVVGDFLPGSQSVTELSSIRSEEELQEEPAHVAGSLAPLGPVISDGDHSTEEEELAERPTPARSSLNIESGSASEEGDSSLGESSSMRPKPKARTHIEKKPGESEDTSDITYRTYWKQQEKVIRKQVPPKPLAARPLTDEEEEVGEEIEEEVMSDEETTLHEEQGPPTPTPAPHPPARPPHVSESEESEPPQVESDSEGVTTVAPPPRRKARMPKTSDQVTIVVASLTLDEDSEVMRDPNVQQLFVEYHFLGVPPDETETPFALPKPAADMPSSYNFSKTILVDIDKHYERRQWLASKLLPDDPDKGRLKFTVVSEPDTDEGDCEEVGVAYVNVRDILKKEKDVKEQDVAIVNPENEKVVIGQLNVSVECLAALKAIDREMQIDGTY